MHRITRASVIIVAATVATFGLGSAVKAAPKPQVSSATTTEDIVTARRVVTLFGSSLTQFKGFALTDASDQPVAGTIDVLVRGGTTVVLRLPDGVAVGTYSLTATPRKGDAVTIPVEVIDDEPVADPQRDAFHALVTATGGKVGVGTATPANKLTVVAAPLGNSISGGIELIAPVSGAPLNFWSVGTYLRSNSGGIPRLAFDTVSGGGTVEAMNIVDGGSVAIGFGGGYPATRLHVNGTITCTTLVEASSGDLKQDVQPLVGALDSVMKLRGVSYAWNDKAAAEVRGKRDVGFLAEELNEVLPALVQKDGSGKPVGIDYGKVTAVAVEAIKQLKSENDELKERLARLEALVAAQAGTK